MENNDSYTEQETLGALFRKLRIERSLDIADVSEETRIPQRTIRAMEADDYDELPAHAFARGFYSLYAKMLDLDREEILQRFSEERSGSTQPRQQGNIQSPSWQHKNVGTMAERPSITLGSIIGFGLLIIVLTSAGISWYAGYNPATDISRWLRSLQKSPLETSQPQTDAKDTKSETTEKTTPTTAPQTNEQDTATTQLPPTGQSAIQYLLAAEFTEAANITVTIDDSEPVLLHIEQGATKNWRAQKTMLLQMAEGTKAIFRLNDISIPIPEPVDGKITIQIPEYLLDSNVHYTN